jgi:adenylate kinase family enzyme
MSLVQNLIKKAFATTNANEAASFLASACNRMKLQNKEQIMQEVSAALVSVNLTKHSSQSLSCITCQDSPDTLQRLQAAEARAATLLSQLREEQQRNKPPQTIYCDTPETINRLRKFENQVTELKKALNISQEMHLKESALVRSVMQREIDKLQSYFNRHKLTAQMKANAHHQEQSEYRQRLIAADTLIKTQHKARLQAEAEVIILYEKLQQLQIDHLSDVERHISLHIQLSKTMDALSTSRNMLSSHIELMADK